MLLRVDAEERNRVFGCARCGVNLIANLALREDRLLLLQLRGWIVAALDVGAAEPGKLDRLAARRQSCVLATRTLCRDLDRGSQHTRIDHLRRHRALPDQLVNPLLVDVENTLELARGEIEIRRADGLVCFLSVLDSCLI